MRLMVVGPTGPLGLALTRRLLEAGHEVVAVARRPDRLADLPQAGLTVVTAPVDDRQALMEAARGCEAAFHLVSWQGRDFAVRRDELSLLYRTNVGGTRNVAQACLEAGVRRLVVTGCHVAGGLPDPHRLDPYPNSLRLAEAEAWQAAARGLEVVILGLGLVAGARSGPFQRLLEDLAAGRFPFFPADTSIPLVALEDAVGAHLAALERGVPGRRYLVQGLRLTWRQLGDLVGMATGWPVVLRPVSDATARLAGQADAAVLSRLRRRRPASRRERLTVLTWDSGEDPRTVERELGLTYGDTATAVRQQLDALAAAGHLQRQ